MTYGNTAPAGNLRYDLVVRYQDFTDAPMILTLVDASGATEAEQDEMFQAVVDLVTEHGGPDLIVTLARKTYLTAQEVTSP